MPEDKRVPEEDREPRDTSEHITEKDRELGYREGSNKLPDLNLPYDADAPSAMPVLDSAPKGEPPSPEPNDTQSSGPSDSD